MVIPPFFPAIIPSAAPNVKAGSALPYQFKKHQPSNQTKAIPKKEQEIKSGYGKCMVRENEQTEREDN